jgi:hypothetical protein
MLPAPTRPHPRAEPRLAIAMSLGAVGGAAGQVQLQCGAAPQSARLYSLASFILFWTAADPPLTAFMCKTSSKLIRLRE